MKKRTEKDSLGEMEVPLRLIMAFRPEGPWKTSR
jgi:hypothetical protein